MFDHDAPFASRSPTVIRCRLKGRLVAGSVPEIVPIVHVAEENPGASLEIDLDEVTFIDAGGIELLMALRSLIQRGGGTLRLKGASDRLRRTAAILKVAPLFPAHEEPPVTPAV